ncbi:hypothetical protein [Sodalis glossinidius]|uniref:hypothetical protein n=1 Tax=Sodalis glossinidius TaxID=63612 RepID=UPI0005A42794|nr:hypothetical protein [Sodalis glossinidius]
MNVFYAWYPENGEDFDYGHEIEADSPDEAVEIWSELNEKYKIISGSWSPELCVAEQDDTTHHFKIYGGMMPLYYIHKIQNEEVQAQ